MSGIWGRMTRRDRLELMAFDSKVQHEGWEYACEHYSPRFWDLDTDLEIGEIWDQTEVEREAFWNQPDGAAVDQINAHNSGRTL